MDDARVTVRSFERGPVPASRDAWPPCGDKGLLGWARVLRPNEELEIGDGTDPEVTVVMSRKLPSGYDERLGVAFLHSGESGHEPVQSQLVHVPGSLVHSAQLRQERILRSRGDQLPMHERKQHRGLRLQVVEVEVRS
jgi:hypothetical protein